MRIRSVKPEFWVSRSIALLTREERLLFVGLWNYCDDEGRGVDDARLIKAAIFPLDDDVTPETVSRWLHGLAAVGRIRRYTVGRLGYLLVENFKEHQSPNRPSPSRLPAPPAAGSVMPHGGLSEASPLEGRGEERRGGEGKGNNVPTTAGAAAGGNVDADFELAWREYPRKPGDSRGKARKAYLARRKAGVTAAALLEGVRAYAAFVVRERTEPRYVKGGGTFFGPDEHWLSDYAPTARKSPGEDVYDRAMRQAGAA